MTECVIFDLDGTLVDSEILCNQAFLDVIPEINVPLHELVKMFGGRKLAWIFEHIESKFDCQLPNDIEQKYRQRVAVLFDQQLSAFSGVREALMDISVPICIATSAPLNKAAHALNKTKLAHIFGDRVFSSYEIGSWKPERGIFLYAADKMNVSPESCLIVEDSLAGINAAKSAGMRVVQFCSHSAQPIHPEYFRSYDQLSKYIL